MPPPAASDTAAAEHLFNRFTSAFATFDAHQVAALFATPGVALREDGTTIALTDHEDVVRYYQAALNRYRSDGCRSCRWMQLEVTAMGTQAMLATVTWELLRDDQTIAASWRQSYCLRKTDHELQIFASATHPP